MRALLILAFLGSLLLAPGPSVTAQEASEVELIEPERMGPAVSDLDRPDTAAAADLAALEDPRSHHLLELDCRSELSRRALTFFANGTLRVREKVWHDHGERDAAGQERILLAELTPIEVLAYFERLRAEDLSEADLEISAPAGAWVDACTLTVDLPGREGPARVFRYETYSSLSLVLSRMVAIARELDARVVRAAQEENRLPSGYQPRAGDVLRRRDGHSYEVVALTTDGRALEVRGVDQPLVLYVALSEVPGEFVELLSRRP